MTNRALLLLYVLPVLAAGLVVVGLARLATASQGLPRNPEVLRKVKGVASHEDVEIDVDDYVAIRPSCFFQPRIAPTPPVQRESVPRPPVRTGMSAVYVVRGIVVHSDPALSRAFIEVPGISEQRVYARGEEVHGSEILSISKDAVVLRRGEEDITLAVRYEDEYADGRRRPDSRSTYSRTATNSKSARSSTSSRYGSPGYRKEPYRGSDPRAEPTRSSSSNAEQERVRLAYQKQREREREKTRNREMERTQEARERESRNAQKQRDKDLMRNMSREERIQFLRNRKLEKQGTEKKRTEKKRTEKKRR